MQSNANWYEVPGPRWTFGRYWQSLDTPYWLCSLDTALNFPGSQLLTVKRCKSGPSSVVLRLGRDHQGRAFSGASLIKKACNKCWQLVVI